MNTKAERLKQERVNTEIPMIMTVRRHTLMQLVNEELQRINQPQIPMDSTVSFRHEQQDIAITDNSPGISFRWTVK